MQLTRVPCELKNYLKMPFRIEKRKISKKMIVFKEMEDTPSKFSGSMCPLNLTEQKERFLRHGITPNFVLKESTDTLEKLIRLHRTRVKFDLLTEAKAILDMVNEKFGDGKAFLEESYGERIDHLEATEILARYIQQNNVAGQLTTYWTPELTCSARMMWHGPNVRYNRPEGRKYSLVIKNSSENTFLRRNGIMCLADHEIGTHFFRMVNDGLQPWFSNRKKFGLRGVKSRKLAAAEEGLAAVNTALSAGCKYLWLPALLYYTACMSQEMSFRDLYEHLTRYVQDPEQRWKHVMRVKRTMKDPDESGGLGSDQVYFEGAVEVLRHIEDIDFVMLYSGKVCLDEIGRIRRVARTDCIKIPYFLRDIDDYKRKLRQIAYINKIIPKPERRVSLTGRKSGRPRLKPHQNTFQRKLSQSSLKKTIKENPSRSLPSCQVDPRSPSSPQDHMGSSSCHTPHRGSPLNQLDPLGSSSCQSRHRVSTPCQPDLRRGLSIKSSRRVINSAGRRSNRASMSDTPPPAAGPAGANQIVLYELASHSLLHSSSEPFFETPNGDGLEPVDRPPRCLTAKLVNRVQTLSLSCKSEGQYGRDISLSPAPSSIPPVLK